MTPAPRTPTDPPTSGASGGRGGRGAAGRTGVVAGGLALSGAALVAAGSSLPWLTSSEQVGEHAAADGPHGLLLSLLGAVLVLAAGLLAWRPGVPVRRVLLGAALLATLLSGWMLAQSEGLYASLAADPAVVPGRGAGGFVALAASLTATALALLPVPAPREASAPAPGPRDARPPEAAPTRARRPAAPPWPG